MIGNSSSLPEAWSAVINLHLFSDSWLPRASENQVTVCSEKADQNQCAGIQHRHLFMWLELFWYKSFVALCASASSRFRLCSYLDESRYLFIKRKAIYNSESQNNQCHICKQKKCPDLRSSGGQLRLSRASKFSKFSNVKLLRKVVLNGLFSIV